MAGSEFDRAMRRDIRNRWEAVIAGELGPRDAAEWAQQMLDEYETEPSFQGLMCLSDLVRATWVVPTAEESLAEFARLWHWMEIVAQFEDDPAAWNHSWARRYVSRLPSSLQWSAAVEFIAAGALSEAEVERTVDGVRFR